MAQGGGNTAKPKTAGKNNESGRFLNSIERLGNKIPNPTIMFVYLIALIAVLSAFMSWANVKVTDTVMTPVPTEQLQHLNEALGGTLVPFDTATGLAVTLPNYTVSEQTFAVRNLLSGDGLQVFFSSFVDNFAAFSVVAVVLVAMAGVGVSEHAGLMAALIRKIVKVAPRWSLAFILIFVGVVSSVASDAGYLILIPLSAAAFLSVGRHPLAGMAAAFAGVGAIFGVNILITPTDSMMTEITNEALGNIGAQPLSVTANFYFSIVCSVVLALVAVLVTVKIVEPRLGKYELADPLSDNAEEEVDAVAEARGLKFALRALIVVVVAVLAISLPPGAPLRDTETGDLIGATPFMASLIFIISLAFLVCGIFYGMGAKTMEGGDAVVGAIAKTFGSLGGLLIMFLMISQFIALFNWTNIPTVAAVEAAQLLERASIPAVLLLIAFILVIFLLDIILPGLVPKWAIFAPIFLPIFASLDVAPQTLLAAYRVGDSPMNVLTPLMVYMPFIVTIAQRYKKDAGIGTVIALMVPYTMWLLVAWIAIFAAWFLLGIPWGPGAPVGM
ncbi:p-aminobenzoyl-glutamate transporter [Arthrobacter alpinus]|uniref:p-aminobenzoyl-glutamate transporter n=1 Tax=Arthrobacter alpinus TaxID=656366 RepID=A0A0S2M0L5_9MICC|nr:AbgT family transporter [Arthrobacter alpinus]ALO67182.1 p-aminobenzoyl-glutamate transporter [Arthrobacter alpinus]